MKYFSIILFILSILYVVLPADFDSTIIGYIDDFMFFMSGFCFMYAQLLDKYKVKSILLLKMMSLLFVFGGAVSLLLLVLFLK